MANKVKFGLSNVHYALITDNGGTISYGTPIALNGAVNLSLDASGDQTDFFADNISYFSTYANQGYSGSLEVAMLDETFLTTILGYTTDTNGALVENASVTPKEFALGFQIQGDDKNRKVWLYRCTCARPSVNAETKTETIEPNTDTLDLTVMPRLSDNLVKVQMTESASNTTAFASFFESVYEAK